MRRWLVVVGALVAAACGSEPAGEPVSPVPRGEAASPFRVGEVPDGYRLAALGRGSYRPDWGSDSVGSTEPFTVLAPEGEEPTAENVAVVSVTGYEGNQGGFHQAATFYSCTGGGQRDGEVDGRRAIFTAADDCSSYAGPWSELLVDRGEDLAVRVRAVGWSRGELVELEREVVPAESRERAPAVTPPTGWRVVGSVDADLVLAMGAAAMPTERVPVPDEAPGPMSARVLGWLQGERQLSVLTLPGAQVDGLVGFPLGRGHGVDVEASTDTEVVLVEPSARVLFREAPWGDLLVVGSYGQPEPLEVLRALADAVEPIDAAEWDAFLVEATGGPGLAADPGFVEVARGRHDGQHWLLQANGAGIDHCVKLGNQRRACADDGHMGSVGWFVQVARPAPGTPGFLLFSVDGQEGEVVVTSGEEVVRAPLAPIPGAAGRAAVVFLERPGHVGDCGDRPVPPTLHVVRADLVAADGSTRCLRI